MYTVLTLVTNANFAPQLCFLSNVAAHWSSEVIALDNQHLKLMSSCAAEPHLGPRMLCILRQ